MRPQPSDTQPGAPIEVGIDAAPDAILVVERGRVARANARACALLGTTEDAVRGAEVSAILVPVELQRLEELERQHAAQWRLPESFRVNLRRADGADVMVDLRFARAGDRLILSARDMSETARGEALIGRLAEIASRAETLEELLRLAEPHLSGLGWTLAYSTVEGGLTVPRVIVGPPDDPVSNYGRSLIGHRLGRDAAPIATEVAETGRALFLDNLPSTRESPLRLAEALDRTMQEAKVRRCVWCPIWEEGRVAAVVAVAGADLTEHDFVAIRLLAAELGAISQNARLRSALIRKSQLAAVGEIGAVLAHEIRHPLGVVMGSLAALSRESGLTAQGRDALAMIHEEATRLRGIVTDVLGFARPLDLVLRPVLVLPLVNATIAACAKSSAPPVEVSIAPELQALADPELLRRVLINVVENALAHGVGPSPVIVRATTAADACRIEVWNAGPPIPDAIRARVFEPFFTTSPSGSGLGLYVVQQGMAAMGGRVELAAKDEGVLVSLVLPVADAQTPTT